MKTINPLRLDDGGSIDISQDGRGGFTVIVNRMIPTSIWLTREEAKLLGSWLLQMAGPEGTFFESAKAD